MLKRYVLFLLVFCCYNYIHTQEINESLFGDSQKKDFVIPSEPYFSIFSVFGGLSALPNSYGLNHTTPNAWLILSGYIPVGREKLYLYTQFRTSFFMGESSSPISAILPIMHMENTKLGFLLGVGGIVKDWRANDIGWHFRVNGGIVFEGAVYNEFIKLDFDKMYMAADKFLNVGLEINAMFYYSIKKHLSINIGFHLGYQVAPSSGDYFYSEQHTYYVPLHYMTYGVSIGRSL